MNRFIATIALCPAVLLGAIVLFSSCGPKSGSAEGARLKAGAVRVEPANRMRLVNGYGSAAALVEAALGAFAASDTAALLGLMVSHEEFENYLYPELGMHYPGARDTSELARQFIWENQYFAAIKGMKKALRELGGKQIKLVAVTFSEGTQQYATYKIHEGTNVAVKLDDGDEADLFALGSVVEMDGRFKLLTFRDRE